MTIPNRWWLVILLSFLIYGTQLVALVIVTKGKQISVGMCMMYMLMLLMDLSTLPPLVSH